MKSGFTNIKKSNNMLNFIYRLVKPIFIFTLFALLFLWGFNKASQTDGEENIMLIKKVIEKAAVCCYAIEGKYPPDYEYLEKNYGININTQKYSVFYSIFASNIMPDITILEKR